MRYVFEVKNLSKNFGGVSAVSNFNAQVKEGEIVGIIGPNGAGKTTILNLISGIYKPDSGQVFLNGSELTGIERWQIARAGVARTFQNIRLFDSLSAVENVMVVLSPAGKRPKEKELFERARTLMDTFGWSDDYDAPVRDLPYGKKRRLELIRALSLEPKLLMLDEPAAGLNPTEIQELIAYIADINREYKIPVILIEHRLEMIMALCDTVYVVSFGKTIGRGTPQEVWEDPAVIAAYLGEEA